MEKGGSPFVSDRYTAIKWGKPSMVKALEMAESIEFGLCH